MFGIPAAMAASYRRLSKTTTTTLRAPPGGNGLPEVEDTPDSAEASECEPPAIWDAPSRRLHGRGDMGRWYGFSSPMGLCHPEPSCTRGQGSDAGHRRGIRPGRRADTRARPAAADLGVAGA